ncbi:DUF2189 domain-containing protein, partial [Rhizobium leguminosarum]|uniref:DUF2189 domain-containing protein n=1 Tax=Rhizobium leguminosarum TaxID=384 RepID=UPI003F9789CA
WLVTAQTLYSNLLGEVFPRSIGDFFRQVFGTSEGMQLIIWGNHIGGIMKASDADILIIPGYTNSGPRRRLAGHGNKPKQRIAAQSKKA